MGLFDDDDDELDALLDAIQKYPSYVAELNGGYVQEIFHRCGKPNADGTVDWDWDTVFNNRVNIRYLLGQLALVHEGVKEHELDGAFAKKAGGGNWTTDSSIMIDLLKLGIVGDYCDLIEKDGKQFIELKLNKLRPTLSPKDPKFAAWWDGAEGLVIQALAAQTEGKQEEALSLYRKAAELGHVEGQFQTAYLYNNGEGTAVNYAEALKWYRKAAERGLVEAQYNAALMYYYGEGTDKNYAEALKWFLKAAEQGNSSSQFKAAKMYDYGEGTAVNKAEALKWYLKAAQQGHADAQYEAARKYDQGEGTAEDEAEARKWYLKAAENGICLAQFNAAGLYDRTGDKAEALKWYVKAAEQGLDFAQIRAAAFYYNGVGTAENKTEALKWYLKGAEQGNPVCQYEAAKMYYKGEGTAVDKAKAKLWFEKAAAQGYEKAKEALRKYY